MTHPVIHHTKKILDKPYIVLPIALGIAAAIVIASVLSFNPGKNYAVTTVGSGTVSSNLSTSGVVKASTETNLAFPKGGRVSAVNVKVGDQVYRSATLASLDSGDARGAVEQAQGTYNAASAAYTKLINGAASSDVMIAQVAYDTTVAEQKIAVRTTYAKLLSSDLTPTTTMPNSGPAPIISGTYTGSQEGTLTIATQPNGINGYFTAGGIVNINGVMSTQVPQPIGNTGLSILFPTGSSQNTLTWSIAIPNTTGPNYTANNSAYQTALQTETNKLAQAQAALDKVKVAPRSEDVAVAEAQVASALGALHAAQGALANDFITAPIDGVITSINDLSVGQIVSANTPVIGIMSKDGFQIESYVSEKDLAVVTPGETVDIVTDAYGPSVVFKGTVVQVAPAASAQPNGQLAYKVTYQFTDKDSRIKPGLSATVNLKGSTKDGVLTIPRTALFLKNGESFVLVVDGKKTENRKVAVGLIGNDTVEVVSGLTEGEKIVTLGQ
jgi:HlyD family secretion protein